MAIVQGRQQAATLDGIRDDHLNRYYFSVEVARNLGLCGMDYVLDAGCGTGYGAYILAKAHLVVKAFDTHRKSIETAQEQYQHSNINFVVSDFETFEPKSHYDFMTMFEVIEHSPEALQFMKKMAPKVRYLVGSVPNENVVPFASPHTHPEHYRHFTPDEFANALQQNGWKVIQRHGQLQKRGKASKVGPEFATARTLVFVAESMEYKA